MDTPENISHSSVTRGLQEKIAIIEVSSRRRRFFAYFTDTIIVTLISKLLMALVMFNSINGNTRQVMENMVYVYIFPIIISFIYFSFFPTTSWWGTPGQRLFGIYLCRDKTFEKLTFGVAFIRVFLFNLLWIISFVIASLVVVGTDIGQVKLAFKEGIEKKHTIHFDRGNFYKERPRLVSFYDKNTNKNIHLFNVIGKSSIVIEDEVSQKGVLYHNGVVVNKHYSDSRMLQNSTEAQRFKSSNDQKFIVVKDFNKNEQIEDLVESLFITFVKIMSYSAVIFLLVLIVPTLFNPRKQTIYDLICEVFVARGKK